MAWGSMKGVKCLRNGTKLVNASNALHYWITAMAYINICTLPFELDGFDPVHGLKENMELQSLLDF